VRILRRGLTLVLLFVALGLVGGFAASAATTKVYRADSQLFLAARVNSAPTSIPPSAQDTQVAARSLIAFVTSPSVTMPVISKLRLNLTAEQLAKKIKADAPANTVLINVHVRDQNAASAARLDNAVAGVFAERAQSVEQSARLTVVHPAVVPTSPIAPDGQRDALVGALIGLLVGLVLAAIAIRLPRAQVAATVGE
jgi:capsular polysaccharide biosynthesis protein